MSDRIYSTSFNKNKAAPAFSYVYDSSLNSGSGAWTPALPSSGGGGSADFTATNIILVTGVNNSTSGNSLLTVANALLSTNNSLSTTANSLLTTTNALIGSGNAYASTTSTSCSSNFTGAFGVSAAREFHSIFGYCSGNQQYLRMFDGTGTNGTFLGVVAVAAQNNFSVDFSAHGSKVTAGIYVAFSSSPSSQVATGPDGIITIIWK